MKQGLPQTEGNTNGKGMSFAIIASRFNHDVTSRLVEGARKCLMERGVREADIKVLWVPGALEIPAVAQRVSKYGVDGRQPSGIVCVGCVIRGDTDHYQFVCAEAMRGISLVALEAEVAVGNAVLTVHEQQQAVDRAGEGMSNKGYEAALAALEVANHFRDLV